jgi:Zn-dependent metalloprotease
MESPVNRPNLSRPGHRPRCFVLPPRILERIALNGTEEQRERALATLAQDTTTRTLRIQHALLRAQTATGAALHRDEPAVVNRTVRDAGGEETLSGKVLRRENDPPVEDVAGNEAFDGLGDTFAFYLDAYHRDSIDDEGLPLNASVHYGDRYDNAFWNGQQMVFGDGDGELFNRFTVAVDIIGHELTHGVTEREAGLAYLNQSGALNESVSDVFGSLVKQYALRQTAADADWLIGAGLLTPAVHGVALRSMREPGSAFDDPVLGTDDQPSHMSGYVRTAADNGGVHTNSGIPNHAFYLAATAIGGFAWEKTGKIWYETLRASQLRPTASFRSFAALTVRQAHVFFGATEVSAVREAWAEVGIKV